MFSGKVYVKNHYSDPECRTNIQASSAEEPRQFGVTFIIRHNHCGMERMRPIRSQGVQYSTVIVVSFHPIFITQFDRAFNIICNYQESDQTVLSEMEIGTIATSSISETLPLPVCSYTIHRDKLDGETVRYARVGDQVVHRWLCDTDVYGMLVHSCYVEDGHGVNVLVVDSKGCHTDRVLLGDPTYVEALNMAYRESYVFRFADKMVVRFKCQIRLCLKIDGRCAGITVVSVRPNLQI
ncbi:unnamed protein product [Soboliphyme baturini]|uniref:ZP domain-containing protein n=1 Tax=Soboliphyme baturini TaxID=241478 RepID=A0A183J0C0_9BILA|nr:unnamed protein product [Soboliphyme baturini]